MMNKICIYVYLCVCVRVYMCVCVCHGVCMCHTRPPPLPPPGTIQRASHQSPGKVFDIRMIDATTRCDVWISSLTTTHYALKETYYMTKETYYEIRCVD